ncbi:MAG TPA: class I SAM-dependent methyltransferase [Actinomycetota bacterium]|nr:class I SAM-dependent methyltransferase [Actinomycetota bacterium]
MNRKEQSIESEYYEHQAFDSDHIRRVRSFYLQFVSEAKLIIELGCGRGEFLQLAAEMGIETLGVDLDPGMIAETRRQGLEAIQADALEFLETTTATPDALFAAHLVEHLSVEQALRMFTGAGKCLKPGGVLIVVTPNPRCLSVILSDFWNDPTHVRPYTIPLMEFLAKQAGLEPVTSGFNVTDEPGAPPQIRVPEMNLPWGTLQAPILPPWSDDQLDGDEGATKQSIYALLQRIYDVNHTLFEQMKVLDENIKQTRHQAQVAVDTITRMLNHLYGPNEIFLVARSPT